MTEAATTLPEETLASVESLDDVANLFVDNEHSETDVEQPEVDEDDRSEAVSDDDVEEQDEESEAEVDESEYSQDEDVTWDSVLGVDGQNIVLDENGEFKGVRVKIDGEVSEVRMKDLIAGFQTNKFNTQKSQALAQERKEFETGKEQVEKEYRSRVESVDKLTQHLNNKLMQDFQNVDWNKLRNEYPGEYAALQQDYQVRQQEIATIMHAIKSEKEELTQKEDQEYKTKKDAFLKKQAEILRKRNPTWVNKEVAKKAFNDLSDFANEVYGFTTEEFSEIFDARAITALQDAMAYRKGKKMVEKKVSKPVPKFQKSAGRSAKKVSKLDKLTKAARSAKGANKRALETDAITELLLSGDK